MDDQAVNLELWDPPGQEEFAVHRCRSYSGTNVFLLCFSVVSPASLDNIVTYWHRDTSYCPGAPVLLVGTKIDLRTDPGTLAHLAGEHGRLVSKEEGLAWANKLGVAGYIECSTLRQQGRKEVFDEAARIALRQNCANNNKVPKSVCFLC